MESCEIEKTLDEKVDEMLRQLAEIKLAFPEGPIAHRLAHEAQIRAAKAEERFWTELKLDLAKKGVWGLLVIIVGLVVIGLSIKVGIGRPV